MADMDSIEIDPSFIWVFILSGILLIGFIFCAYLDKKYNNYDKNGNLVSTVTFNKI